MSPRSWAVLGALVAVQALLVWGTFVAAPHPGGDNAGYVALAHALQSGQGYTELWDPTAPPHTKYPPVFPALLAVAMALGAGGWASLKAVPVLAALAVTAGVFLWARRRLGEGGAAVVALLTGLSPSLLYHAHWILSDVPFLAFTALALWRMEGLTAAVESPGGDDPPSGRRPGPAALAAGALVLLAYLTRSAGLPLALAAVGALAWRRRWLETGVVSGVVGIPAVLWWLRGRAAGPGEGRYGSELFLLDPYQPDLGTAGVSDFVTRVVENLVGYGTRFLPETLVGAASPVPVVVTLGLLALALFGWVRALRRGPGAAELFVPLYAGLILIWPQVWSGDRFALPLVPLLLVFAAEALRHLLRNQAEGVRSGVLLGGALLVALPAGQAWFADREEARACAAAAATSGPWACGGEALVDFTATARWARGNLPQARAVLTRKPRIWYLVSGIPTRTYPFSEAPGALTGEARELGAGYVVLDYIGRQGIVYVGGALGREPAAFCEVTAVWSGGQLPATRLLAILPEGADSGSRVTAEGGIDLAPCDPEAGAPVVRTREDPGLLDWRIPLLATEP